MPPFLIQGKSWLSECLEIAREVFGPEPPEDHLEYVLWEHTGYPCFFDGDPRVTVRRQLEEHREALASRPTKEDCSTLHDGRVCECDLPRCPSCGYTQHDAAFHLDHDLCLGTIPA